MSGYSLFEMHRGLCVFKKQTAIPVSVCRVLWNVKSDEAAKRIGKGFADVGLGDIEVEKVGERHVVFIRLHDLVHTFAMECANEKNEVSTWHERLLEGYISRVGSAESVRKWWDVEERSGEEYMFANLCRHLASSDNVRELAGLLLSGEWSQFRHKHGGLSAWKQDFSAYMGRRAGVALSEHEEEIESGMRMVRDAVVESWAALHRNQHELGFQIFGRLVDCKNSVVGKYLESIESMQCGPWLKPLQRVWTRPGESGMAAEFVLAARIWEIAVQRDPFIAVAAAGKEIAIMDLKEKTVICSCIGHGEEVRKVEISADGKRIFSLSSNSTVRQWDAQSGKEYTDNCVQLDCEESFEDDKVTCAAFCMDRNFVITGSRMGRLEVWDLNSGERIGPIMDATKWVSCVEVSPTGQIVSAGVDGGTLLLWNVQTFTPLWGELKGYLQTVFNIAFSPDGRFVASAGGPEDGSIRLWEVENRTQVGDPFGYWKDGTYSITFSEDGQQIISGHYCGSITVWDVARSTAIRSWEAHSFFVTCVTVTGDTGKTCVISGGGESVVRVWDLETASNVRDGGIQHGWIIEWVALSSDGRFFVTTSLDGKLRIWNAVDGTALGGVLCVHEYGPTCIAMSPDSRRVVSGSKDRVIRVWDAGTGAQVGDALRRHEGWVNCVTYSAGGKFVVSGSRDCTARVWRVIDDGEVEEGMCEPASNRVRRAQAGSCDVSSSREPLRLELILNHKLPKEKQKWDHWVTCVTISPNGEKVLSGLCNGDIWVWYVASGECIHRAQTHSRIAVQRIEISKGNTVVTKNGREELHWQFDDEGGLARVLENENDGGVAQAEQREGPVYDGLNTVVCRGRTVLLSGSGRKIATLPDRVQYGAWEYDARHRVLCTGDPCGRVWFY